MNSKPCEETHHVTSSMVSTVKNHANNIVNSGFATNLASLA